MFRATHTPPLSYLLDDLLTRDTAAIAQHLGIGVRTLERYKATDDAPRAVLLALFYESRWGYALMETTAHNGELYARQEVEGLKRANAALRARVARLERTGDFGAANAPVMATGFLKDLASIAAISDAAGNTAGNGERIPR